ncbi:MAG TPA: sigma 54-interacting transcriptional regulator [Sandaracinaceae bacterium LLY-WYZ-13_1]|nr:sigma 54-interacting transcriptional regulator [Sandaracinaceae bacterium LLY-WYZ-13_1]
MASDPPEHPSTAPMTDVLALAEADAAPELELDGFRLEVVSGAPEAEHTAEAETCRLGSHASNDLVVDHPSVSRMHAEVRVEPRGAIVQDLGSLNGTWLDGVRVERAWLRDGSLLRLGEVTVRFHRGTAALRLPLASSERFGRLAGRSVPMRRAFAMLERCAASEATVLIQGETGTGKEGAAEGIHDASPRADGPFVVIDCGALPTHLLQSELFGHVKGAFTGAVDARSGAFEVAEGGTVFLDEIGELPLELQPKLLRVLAQRTIRRVGSTERREVDVRLVAATHRPLDELVNSGAFRADLYYRLAVLRVTLPPLRERLDDLPVLVAALLDELGAEASARERLTSRAYLRRLRARSWPGNVRELRNHLERALVFEEEVEPGPPDADDELPPEHVDPSQSWSQARAQAIARFEKAYLRALLERHAGNVSRAARAAGVDRVYVHRLLRKHGLR